MNKTEIRKIKKGIELLELVLRDLNKNANSELECLRRDTFYHLFYNDNRLDELFLVIIPTDEIEKISRVLLIIKTANSYSSVDDGFHSQYGNVSKSVLSETLNQFLLHLKSTLAKYGFNIFYSWQTDTISTTNRNFIEDSLKKAIKDVNNRLSLPLQLDKDTANREGSPDIVRTILEKIDECLLFVADISITGQFNSHSGVNRCMPNANVLYELGYAQGVLGESNIIMIFNEATGRIDDLPFDLRGRRITKYFLKGDESTEYKKNQKDMLSCHLSSAIKHIVNTDLR